MRVRLGSLLLGVLALGLSGCATIRPPPHTPPSAERALLTTGYCDCGECCSWHRTCLGIPVYSSGPRKGQRKQVGITASGTRARQGTLAADTSRYPFGTIMYIPGYGFGRVEDRGEAIKGDHIDLHFSSHRAAQEWGRRYARVKIWY
jgi:3D (Asp-Asp-Asp) domain-containing protein